MIIEWKASRYSHSTLHYTNRWGKKPAMLDFGTVYSLNTNMYSCVFLVAKRYMFEFVHTKRNEHSGFFLTSVHITFSLLQPLIQFLIYVLLTTTSVRFSSFLFSFLSFDSAYNVKHTVLKHGCRVAKRNIK